MLLICHRKQNNRENIWFFLTLRWQIHVLTVAMGGLTVLDNSSSAGSSDPNRWPDISGEARKRWFFWVRLYMPWKFLQHKHESLQMILSDLTALSELSLQLPHRGSGVGFCWLLEVKAGMFTTSHWAGSPKQCAPTASFLRVTFGRFVLLFL